MVDGSEEGSSISHFDVRILDHNDIFNTVIEERAQEKSKDLEGHNYYITSVPLSNTSLDGRFITHETTEISIDEGVNSAFFQSEIRSILYIGEEERSESPFGYYNAERLETIQSLLDMDEIYVDLHGRNLEIKSVYGDENSVITVSFRHGNKESAESEYGKDLKKRLSEAQKIEDDLERKLKMGYIGHMLKRGGPVEPRIDIYLELSDNVFDDKTKLSNTLQHYAEVYKKVIKAIYVEKGLPLPQSTIILGSAK